MMIVEDKLLEGRVRGLIDHVTEYRVVEALLKYYHRDFHAYENLIGPRIGLNKSIARVEREREGMQVLYYLRAKSWMCKDDESIIHWAREFTDLHGRHWFAEKVSLAKWRDGKIYEEKYVYNLPVELSAPSTDECLFLQD
ncbi:MAG: hypothetical protein AAFZ52_02140 [Bacteroidota bacterium]